MDPTQLYQQIAQQSGGTMDPLQVSPPQQSLPAQPQQPAQGGGIADEIGKFLMHPAVQALAGAYFGAISSPRYRGIGGALGQGGLTGLATLGQAEQLQQRDKALQAEAAQRNATFALDQQKTGLEQKKIQQTQQEIEADKAKNAGIGPDSAARILATHKNMAADFDVPTLAAMPKDKVATLIATYRKESGSDPLIQSQIARNLAEADRAERPPTADAGPKAKLAEIYGPGGATQEVSVGAGYAPPKDWSLRAPSEAKPETEDTAATKQQTHVDNLIRNFNLSTGGAPNDPLGLLGRLPAYQEKLRQYLVTNGIPPDVAAAQAGITSGASRTPLIPGATANAATPPAHATTGEGLPPGSKPNGDGTWTLPDGTKVAPR